ncbi:MAG: hypothetical protein INR71_06125 [Terriglobus roseus]|nr:hypothetical protein [Terriglobus roseus]
MPAAAAAAAAMSVLPAASASPSGSGRKSQAAPEKKYKCQFCNRAFSRSEHRSRHERSRKCIVFPILIEIRIAAAAPHRAHARVVSRFFRLARNAETRRRGSSTAGGIENQQTGDEST